MVNKLVSKKTETLHSSLVGDRQLFRLGERVESPQKILLVGNGAVDEGWSPLATALGCEPINSKDTLASLLAGYTFQYRNIRNEILIDLHAPDKNPRSLFSDNREKLDKFRSHRRQVANAYQTAKAIKKISLLMCDPVNELLQAPEDLGVITTNWDGLIWNQSQFHNVIQIHGLSDYADSLIFPSELSTDEQIYELAQFSNLSTDAKSVVAEIGKHYRGTMAPALRNAHRLALQWIYKAKEITFWGLALHPYDAELLTVIQHWALNSNRENGRITIINPNSDHRNRIAAVLAASSCNRRDYDPIKCKWLK